MSLGKPVIMQQHMDDEMSRFATDYACEQLQNLFHEKVSPHLSFKAVGHRNVHEESIRD